MDIDKFNQLYLCEWKQSHESIALDKALDEHYNRFDFDSDMTSTLHLRELRFYAKSLGFSDSEFNDAKYSAEKRRMKSRLR